MFDRYDFWFEEERKGMEGWDFSHLNNRWESQLLPWDYASEVKKRLDNTKRLLDLGTGGGEFLPSLNHPHRLTSVTEGYPPNLRKCQKELTPLGITVKAVDDTNRLPFLSQSFDVVIDRHEAYDLKEVYRVLRPGGYFITQQCGGRNNEDLSRRFYPNFVSQYASFNFKSEVQSFIKTGFRIEKQAEFQPKLKFFDVGAIVFYAKQIPWEFPDFSVNRFMNQLNEIHHIIEKQSYLESTEERFLIVARK